MQASAFTHGLAMLTLERHSQEDKLAIVEAILLSRMQGKRAKLRLKQLEDARRDMVRRRWKYAIHKVILNSGIAAVAHGSGSDASADYSRGRAVLGSLTSSESGTAGRYCSGSGIGDVAVARASDVDPWPQDAEPKVSQSAASKRAPSRSVRFSVAGQPRGRSQQDTAATEATASVAGAAPVAAAAQQAAYWAPPDVLGQHMAHLQQRMAYMQSAWHNSQQAQLTQIANRQQRMGQAHLAAWKQDTAAQPQRAQVPARQPRLPPLASVSLQQRAGSPAFAGRVQQGAPAEARGPARGTKPVGQLTAGPPRPARSTEQVGQLSDKLSGQPPAEAAPPEAERSAALAAAMQTLVQSQTPAMDHAAVLAAHAERMRPPQPAAERITEVVSNQGSSVTGTATAPTERGGSAATGSTEASALGNSTEAAAQLRDRTDASTSVRSSSWQHAAEGSTVSRLSAEVGHVGSVAKQGDGANMPNDHDTARKPSEGTMSAVQASAASQVAPAESPTTALSSAARASRAEQSSLALQAGQQHGGQGTVATGVANSSLPRPQLQQPHGAGAPWRQPSSWQPRHSAIQARWPQGLPVFVGHQRAPSPAIARTPSPYQTAPAAPAPSPQPQPRWPSSPVSNTSTPSPTRSPAPPLPPGSPIAARAGRCGTAGAQARSSAAAVAGSWPAAATVSSYQRPSATASSSQRTSARPQPSALTVASGSSCYTCQAISWWGWSVSTPASLGRQLSSTSPAWPRAGRLSAEAARCAAPTASQSASLGAFVRPNVAPAFQTSSTCCPEAFPAATDAAVAASGAAVCGAASSCSGGHTAASAGVHALAACRGAGRCGSGSRQAA